MITSEELERRKAICLRCPDFRTRDRAVVWCHRRAKRPNDGVYCLPWAANEYRTMLLDEKPNGGCPKWHEEKMGEADFDIEAFPSLVAGKTVAVVGNAPTATEFDHAAKIDACDVVVRFNRFTLDPPQVGRKTTVIGLPACYGPAYPSRAMLARTEPKLILLVPPKLDGIENYLTRIQGYSHSLVPIGYFGRLTQETGCRPTAGLAAVCYLLDCCEPQSIYLTGFSFSRLPRDHYFNADGFNYGVHDPVKDLHAYARRHDPARVEVDPHIQRILYTGQPADEMAEMKRRGGKPYSEPHRWVYREIAEAVAGKTVLEIGAGIGYGIAALLEAGAATVTGIEPHSQTCEHVRSRFPGIEVHQSDFIEYDGPTCDVASCVEVVEHLPPVAVHPFLTHARRLCRRLYLSTPDRKKHNHGRRTELEWKLAVKAAGFSVVEVRRHKWAMLLIAE